MRRILGGVMLLAACLVCASTVAACPGWHSGRARARALLGACFANQKTLAGAIEMYNLDKNVQTVVGRVSRVRLEDQQRLVADGYLQSPLRDPGQQDEQADHYVQVPVGCGIACLVHGFIGDGTSRPAYDPARPAYEQFVSNGITDPAVLAAASKEPPPDTTEPFPTGGVAFALILTLVNELMCGLARRINARPKPYRGLIVAGRLLFAATLLTGSVPSARTAVEIPMLFLSWVMLFASFPVFAGSCVRSALRKVSPLLVPAIELKGGRS